MAYQIFKFSTTSVSEQIADFAVKLDVNGGDTLEESVLIPNAEGKLSVLPTPTRSNHTFDGWFTAATGGEKVTTDTVFTQDTTIYAHGTAVASGGSSRPTYPPTVTAVSYTHLLWCSSRHFHFLRLFLHLILSR